MLTKNKTKRLLSMLLMLVILISTSAMIGINTLAATSIRQEAKETYILGSSYGLRAFSVTLILTDAYTLSGTSRNFNSHEQWWAVESTWQDLPGIPNPFSFSVSNVRYITSSGSQLYNFTMQPYSSFFPGGLWRYGARGNYTSVTYPQNTTNKSTFGVSIYSDYIYSAHLNVELPLSK